VGAGRRRRILRPESGGDDIPFGPVAEVPPEAGPYAQIAAWLGRLPQLPNRYSTARACRVRAESTRIILCPGGQCGRDVGVDEVVSLEQQRFSCGLR
jgi:hypothetical protein